MLWKKGLGLKIIVIVLLVAYVVMSCFPCVNITITQWGEDGITITRTTDNSFSVFMVVFLVLQIGLIWLDRPVLQLCAGLCGVFCNAWVLLKYISKELIERILGSIQYFFIVAPSTGNGGADIQHVVTPLGQCLIFFAVILVVADIALSFLMRRCKKAAKQADQETSEDREEVVQ